MLRSIKALSSIAIISALTACSSAAPSNDIQNQTEQKTEMAVITGKLTYRERIALRPGFTLTVTLSDISIADRMAPVIAETSRALTNEQVPLPFELTTEQSRFKPGHTYSVRGALTDPNGNLAWTTDTVYEIDTKLSMQDLGVLPMVGVRR